MRINGHAHIFNLQTVLTEEALGIMVGRLERTGVPAFVVDAVRRILDDQLRHPEYLVEDEILRRFVRGMAASDHFRQFLNTAGSLPVEVRVLGEGAEALATDLLRAALNHLSAKFAPSDDTGTSIFDVFETLRLAMQPDILGVADQLMRHLRPDDGIVALMMDIVREPELPRDRNNFLAQIDGTADAAVQRPGRIFPFIAVNPIRSNHFALMQRAVEERGFAGVKLYPSLGFSVKSAAMKKVLKYCEEKDLPIVIHSTRTGFFKSAQTVEFSDPAHWEPLLEKRPDLRICFAHCGGWGGFSNQDADHHAWSERIFGLMDSHQGVYADLAYHVTMMSGGPPEETYLKGLRELLKHPVRGERIIFGTDSWLLRLNVTDESFWRYFEMNLTPGEFGQIAEVAPRRFLGLPDAAGAGMRENIRRHLEFLERHREHVGAEPAPWVRTVSGAAFTPVATDPGWTKNNRAHVRTFQFFRFDAQLIAPQHISLGFEKSGKLRLRQLGYWTKDHEPPAVFEQRVLETAVGLEQFCRAGGGTHEGDHTRDGVIAILMGILMDGDRTLATAAAGVDALFLFTTEVQA